MGTKSATYRNSRTAGSQRRNVGLLSLILLFVCGLAASASAQWTLLPTSPAGVNLAGIQVGTQAWGRDISGNVYLDQAGTFILIAPSGKPQFAHITVGQGKTPMWGLDFSGKSYFYNGSSFVNVPLPTGETFTAIGAGAEGVWAVNSETGHVFEYKVEKNAWEAPATGQPSAFMTNITVGNFTIGPWTLDNKNDAWLYNNVSGFFDGPIAGLPSGVIVTQLAVGNGQVWVIASSSSDNVYLYDFNLAVESFFQPYLPYGSATLSEVSESTDENLWGVNAGQVYQYNSSKVEFLLTAQPPESIFEIKVGAAGIFAVSTGTGHVYQFK